MVTSIFSCQPHPGQGISPENAELWSQLRVRLADYRAEVEVVRKARDAATRRDYELLCDGLQTWNNLKSARTHQGFSVTPWMVSVYRQATDEASDRAYLHEQVRAEVREQRALYDEAMQQQQRAYLDRQARRLLDKEALGVPNEIDLDSLPANLRVPFDKVEKLRELKGAGEVDGGVYTMLGVNQM